VYVVCVCVYVCVFVFLSVVFVRPCVFRVYCVAGVCGQTFELLPGLSVLCCVCVCMCVCVVYIVCVRSMCVCV